MGGTTDFKEVRGPLLRGSVPLYRQLLDLLRQSILHGQVSVGETLPTEQALIELYGVSRITVRQALRELEAEGLIRRNRPKGSVVVRDRSGSGHRWTFESLQDVVAFAEQTSVRIASFLQKPAPEDIAEIFGVQQKTKLPRVHGMRFLRGEPLSEFFFWLAPSVASQLNRRDVDSPALFAVIESRLGVRLVEAEQIVWCERAGRELAQQLNIRPSAPVLAVQRTYMAAGRTPVEVAISRFAGSRYRLRHVLRRL
jgi:GntR family transcriptional regulator